MATLTKDKTMEVIQILDGVFPDAKAELDHTNEFEMLIATILSAQCTDVRVNMITKELFAVANTPEDILELGLEKLKEIIRPCGFFNQKGNAIIGTCEILLNEHAGRVPDDFDLLIKLPGVGRKTANVVMSTCFGHQAIAVDTHVFRVSNRIGICDTENVDATEKCLQRQIDEDYWTKSHHLLIFQGRRVCSARSPKCGECSVTDYCKYYQEVVSEE